MVRVAARESVTVDAGGREVVISSPRKVFFPERGETKLDLVNYYLAVAEPLMAAMADRPTLMERYPDGAGAKSFFQKRVPAGAPDWLETTVVSTPNGTTSNALVAVDVAHIIWAVNLGCLGFHPWPNKAATPGDTDELRIDLDPQPGVSFAMIREAAHRTRELLDELGVVGYPKTTGNRGLHIYVRIAPGWDGYQVRQAAVALARELARRHPDLVTDAWWKEERGSRVFIDFNQNAPHKTVFGAWCVRPRVGAQVSTPLSWDDVDTVDPNALTMGVIAAQTGNPWVAMNDHPQSLDPLVDLWDRDRAAGLTDAPWPPVYPKMPDEPPRVAPSRAKKS